MDGIRIRRENEECAKRRRETPQALRIRGVQYNPELWMVGCAARWDDLEATPCVIRTRRDGKRYNAAAGGIRNAFMLTWHPKLIVAFAGGTGTADMCSRGRVAGIEVINIP